MRLCRWNGICCFQKPQRVHKPVPGRPAEWDNTGKTGQVVTFLSNDDVAVELAALLPELGAAIRSSKGSGQHQIKPVAALGTMFFHRHRRGSYLIPQPIRRVEQETLFHTSFVMALS